MKLIPEAELVHGRVYRIKSRNLIVGVWNAATHGFIGIRMKFDSRYLFTEYHHDYDPHVGTVGRMADLEVNVPEGIAIVEGESVEEDGRRFFRQNKALFTLLERIEEPINAQIVERDRRLTQEAESRRWRPQTEREHFIEQGNETRRAWMDEQRKADVPWNEISQGMMERIRERRAEADRLFGPDPDMEGMYA